MTKPDDVSQEAWDAALSAVGQMDSDWSHDGATNGLRERKEAVEIVARAIMAAKEEEREDIWVIASGNAAGRREMERLAMKAGDAEGCLLHAMLARENDRIAAAIRNRKLANNTNKD